MIYDVVYHAAAALSVLNIGLAVAYLMLGIDDVMVDAFFWTNRIWRWLRRRARATLTVTTLRLQPQQRVAIFVPCWHEEEVIDRVLRHACQTVEYNHYDILVGVYPNDEATIRKVREVSELFPRVHVIINDLPGPTTKGQNLNCVFKKMQELEGDDPFKIVVLHDAEDIIHPFSLSIYNRLIPRKAMVQLPVFPLETGVSKWTAWTYADEFVEAHLKDIFVRERLGGFVPSAGVGCAFNREILQQLEAEGQVFPSDALTEDYMMGMRLDLRGGETILVHQVLPYAWASGKKRNHVRAKSYVATRAYFPDTFKTAVRQRRRWITGICFQGWQSAGWVGGMANRYALYRDRRGIVGSPLTLLGYAVMLCGGLLMAWHAIDDQIAVPSIGNNRETWMLFDAVIGMTLLRLLQKSYFVSLMYGPLQGVLCIARVPWCGIINGLATVGAGLAFFNATVRGRKLAWQKTAHVFPTNV